MRECDLKISIKGSPVSTVMAVLLCFFVKLCHPHKNCQKVKQSLVHDVKFNAAI